MGLKISGVRNHSQSQPGSAPPKVVESFCKKSWLNNQARPVGLWLERPWTLRNIVGFTEGTENNSRQ